MLLFTSKKIIDGTTMKIADRIINLNAKPKKLLAALNSENGQMTLAEGSVFSNGTFELNLPDIVVGYSYLTSFKNVCENIKIEPASLKIAIVDSFWLFDSNTTLIGYIFQGSTQAAINGRLGEKMVSRWYANQSSQIYGQASCGPKGMAVNFELNLKKGWNEVIRHFQPDTKVSIHKCQNSASMLWFMSEEKRAQKIPMFHRFIPQY
jgi:hypothetical protein